MGRLLILLAFVALSSPAWAGAWDTDPPPCVWINEWHCVVPSPGHCVQINRWHCVPAVQERKH